jgi:hypothetical protein
MAIEILSFIAFGTEVKTKEMWGVIQVLSTFDARSRLKNKNFQFGWRFFSSHKTQDWTNSKKAHPKLFLFVSRHHEVFFVTLSSNVVTSAIARITVLKANGSVFVRL